MVVWPQLASVATASLAEGKILTVEEIEASSMEEKPRITAVTTVQPQWLLPDFENLSKLCSVTVLVFRFVKKLKAAVARGKLEGSKSSKRTIKPVSELLKDLQPIQRHETVDAENFWCLQTQASAFANEIKCLTRKVPLPRNSKLTKTAPFIDQAGFLRVGGRLTNAPIPYNERHPIILPGKSLLAEKLIARSHLWLLHGGEQLVTRNIHQNYWLMGGRNAIRSGIFGCVTCKRFRKQTETQKMAPLVAARVTPVEWPFAGEISVDYAGPFELKRWSGRCKTTVKGYVCVFICMATRAIHLETVGELSTDAFIDAYLNFASSRGHCRGIISDNGTNFVGAKRKFHEMSEIWRKSSHSEVFTGRKINWTFIMPRSPAQGGSHEAAVKLFKAHFNRVVKNEKLSVTEFHSLVKKIEGCLNSRPLCPQTEDASEDLALTPAHFLNGRPVDAVAVDQPEDSETPLTLKWRRLQSLRQIFWKRWQSDYINNLQMRSKWQQPGT